MSSGTPSTMILTLYAALGGAIGAAARYQVGVLMSRWAGPNAEFPWGTFTVNIAGSFVIGALLGWFARGGADSESFRVFLIAGLMGGFTTFSALSAETFTMIYRGSGLLAAGYIAASVIGGMILFGIGLVGAQAAS